MFSKIVISGGWSYGNLGDEVIARATMGLLEKVFPEAEKVYTSFDTEDFLEKHGMRSLEAVHSKIKKLRCDDEQMQEMIEKPEKYGLRTYADLFDEDTLFIMSGGGYFDGNWTSQFVARIVEIELAIKGGAKAAILGQSIGPFVNEEQVQVVAKTLGKCSFINVRDEISRELLNRLMPEKEISCTADIALTISDFIPRPVKEHTDKKICNLVVQIYTSYVENGVVKRKNDRIWKRITLILYRYNLAWVLLIRMLSKKLGMQCRIVLNVQGTSKISNNHFEKYANQLKKYSGCSDMHIVNNTTVQQFCEALAEGDAIVSCKMHPLIISTSYGVPAYAISQHYKIDAFMEWVGRKANCQRNSRFSPFKIISLMKDEEKNGCNLALVQQRKEEIYEMVTGLKNI